MTSAEPVTGGMRLARITLVGIGVLGLGWGAWVLFDTVRVTRIPGVAVWVGAAIVLHDAVLAPLVFGMGLLLRRAGRRVSGTIVVVAAAAIVVGSMMSLIVAPIIIAASLDHDNPSLLPLNYGLNLGIFWVVVAAIALALSAWLYARARRANERPSRRQS